MNSPAPVAGEWFAAFEAVSAETAPGVRLFARKGGTGPALLMLHGHPQTHSMWHRVAPTLSTHFSLVMADLRGYGDSSRPLGGPPHTEYSKRTMALDMVRLMEALGFAEFSVLALDRGARVAHRLALDHPARVQRMTLLDIAPTLPMYEETTEAFARAYWHWFFLIQPAPTPERLIENDPEAYVREVMGRRDAGLAPFDPRALQEYIRCLSQPGSAHGLCEDYRASATIDLEHDRASRAARDRVRCPLQVLWGQRGTVHRCFDPLALWRRAAHSVCGEPLDCGHYIAEEAPEVLLDRALPFLAQAHTFR